MLERDFFEHAHALGLVKLAFLYRQITVASGDNSSVCRCISIEIITYMHRYHLIKKECFTSIRAKNWGEGANCPLGPSVLPALHSIHAIVVCMSVVLNPLEFKKNEHIGN